MKQLNNISNGNVIKIVKIRENNILYKIYENTEAAKHDSFGISKTCQGIDFNTLINKDVTSLEVLQLVAANEPEFIISEDLKNWYITKGSTDLDTTVRVFIVKDAYDIALENKDIEENEYYNLYEVIIGVQLGLPSRTAQITKNYMVQYLEKIFPQSKAVLDYYINTYPELGIFIEYKN